MSNEVSDYQLQLAKMKRYNRTVQWATAGFIILLFVFCIGYAIWSTTQSRSNTAQILDRVKQTQDVSSKEAEITRQGGDIIRCILNYPANTRTLEQIYACYPGGSPEAWDRYRKEALNGN
jgi:predicted negative regulator of RcsB-dependent stress response